MDLIFKVPNFTLSAGSYGRTNEVLEYGEQFGNVGVYLGANFNYDNGWRDHSFHHLIPFLVILDIDLMMIQNYS